VKTEEQAIIIKYFEYILTSIENNKKGITWAKEHLKITPEQMSRLDGENETLIQMKNMYVGMAEELHISLV